MIRLFIFCLLLSIGYVPNVSAYGAVGTAPPVEKKIKKKVRKKKRANKKYRKNRRTKGTAKMKNSTMFFTLSLIWSLGAITLSLIGLGLGFTTYIYVMLIVFLIASITCLIAGYVYRAREKENPNSLGEEKKKRDGNSLN